MIAIIIKNDKIGCFKNFQALPIGKFSKVTNIPPLDTDNNYNNNNDKNDNNYNDKNDKNNNDKNNKNNNDKNDNNNNDKNNKNNKNKYTFS